MRCTNNFRGFAALLASVSLSVFLCGCGGSDIPLDYKVNNNFSDLQKNSKAEGFATYLAVTDQNVAAKNGFTAEGDSAAGLFDVNNAEVLYAKNVHAQMNPASLTKVMTAICAIKYGNPDDIIICSDNINKLESGASTCGLKPGDQLTLNEAMRLMLLPSANDAAIAIAEHIGGSVDDFAVMMNEEANRLGATNTHFVNPHGLTADDHYTTVYDMYLIANEARKYTEFTDIIAMQEYSCSVTDRSGGERTLEVKTSNKFVDGTYTAPDRITVIGGKTGTTAAAGSCLVLLANDSSGNPYIAVILKASDRGLLYEQMIKLLEDINSR